jgi:hypothetical protein
MGISKKKYSRGGLLAPNGKPSNLNATQYELVRSKEFKAWFGDWENDPKNASKVVDENGEPLVVYHGTYVETPFYVFDFNKADLGFHFGTYEQAKNRSETKPFFATKKSTVNPFFLNIRTLFYTSDIGEWEYPQRYIDMFVDDNIITELEAKKNGFYTAYDRDENKRIRDFIIKKHGGNVGFVYNNKHEGDGESYIVLQESQIKLAQGTNKTFDSKNPDIRFEKGGNIKKYNSGGLTNAEINDKIMEVEKRFWGDIRFSGYHDTDGVLVRLKDHPARWSNFIEYNTEKKSGSNTDYKFLSIIISDDVKLYDVEENVQKFYDEYLDDFPNAEAKEIVLPSDTSVDEIIEEIEYEVKRMNKPKKFEKGGILHKKDNVGWTIFGTIALIVTLGKVNALKK